MNERVLKIKQHLKTMNIDYEQLAKIAKMPKSTISKILGGFTLTPRIDTLEKIEDALNIRRNNSSPAPQFSAEEIKLIQMYRKCADTWKKTVNQIAKAGADDSKDLEKFTKENFTKTI